LTFNTCFSAVRFCGSTFAYTSIAILLNYRAFLSISEEQLSYNAKVSPDHVNGLANGVAQSIVSLARFVGPILGGYVSDLL
jgi:predicted MFS family arabinose efflux permease